MSDGMPRNTAELLGVIEEQWQYLMGVVKRIPPEQMARPDAGGWSPKDNLAHLSAWMRLMQEAYLKKAPQHEAMGIPAEQWAQLDEEGVNAVLVKRNRERTAEDVLAELHATHAEVVRTLRNWPFEQLAARREDDPQGRPWLVWVLGNTSEHFLEHGRNIEKALG